MKRGYRFETLAQQFNPKRDFEHFDLILCLDQSNLSNVKNLPWNPCLGAVLEDFVVS